MKREHILGLKSDNTKFKLKNDFNKLSQPFHINPLDIVIGHREWLDNGNGGMGDESVLQVIGYSVITHPQKGILCYRRKGSEGRLNAKISVGFGGHISILDVCAFDDADEIDFNQTLIASSSREINEEINFLYSNGYYPLFSSDAIDNIDNPEMLGVIACDRTQVDRLHIGFVNKFILNERIVEAHLGDHGDAIFWVNSLTELDKEECEEWTKILIESGKL